MPKKRVAKPRKRRCSYPGCSETESLVKCRYCGKFYCQKHFPHPCTNPRMQEWYEKRMNNKQKQPQQASIPAEQLGVNAPPQQPQAMECAKYDCHETRGLRKCWYCGKFYCQKHIQAKPPSAPPWIDKQPLWRIEDAHPCPQFNPPPPPGPIVMSRMKSRYPYRSPERVFPSRQPSPSWSYTDRSSPSRYSPPREPSWIARHGRLILFLILIGLLYYIYQNPGYLQSGNNALQSIVNNTKIPNPYASNNSAETPPKNESLNLSTLDTDILNGINNERSGQGSGQLAWNDTIAAVARIYSNNTLLYGRPTYINGTLDYSIADVVTYTLYMYESCSFNSTGSLQYCTLLKQKDALSLIGKEWFNKTSTQQVLTFQNFTDAGVGVVTNGSYAYITVILTDTQAWESLKKLRGEPANREFTYVLRGKTGKIDMTVYSGIDSLLAGLPRSYYCSPSCPSDAEIQLRFLDQKEQKDYLGELVDKIRSQTSNKDDQARIAISLVQQIPYDWEGFKSNQLTNRYPYEVIYDTKGVCGEKSRLLAFLLRELGYGVVLFNYKTEQHMTVGIKCPTQYAYYTYGNSGYCFVEAAAPTIITDSQSDYVGVGKLRSTPEILPVSGGNSFDSVSEEYSDAQDWNKIMGMGQVLDQYNYYRWQSLVTKYGIQTSSGASQGGSNSIQIVTIRS